MSHHRERVAADLRGRISRILALEVSDPRLEGAFVTGVRLSRDQSHLRVFYRTLGARDEAERALAQAGGFIRSSLARSVSLRRIPELHFHFDDSIDRGRRVDAILRELNAGEPAPSGMGSPAPGSAGAGPPEPQTLDPRDPEGEA